VDSNRVRKLCNWMVCFGRLLSSDQDRLVGDRSGAKERDEIARLVLLIGFL